MRVRRLVFLLHRWSALVLGVFVFVWFVSGVALAWYPWPALTESAQASLLEPFRLTRDDTTLLGFRESAARSLLGRDAIVGGRLVRRAGRLLYELDRDEDGLTRQAAMVDARTGRQMTPLSAEMARQLAAVANDAGHRGGDRGNHAVANVDLLTSGDVYMLSAEYAHFFPAYRVRFASGRWVYVSRDRGSLFAVVTSRARWLTWLGPVPHWLYFPWLYRHAALWTWLNILIPACAVLIAVSGLCWGMSQLLPVRVNGAWARSPHRGVSRWHHVAGVVFGVLVLTWTVSGVLEMFGSDHSVRPGQAARLRGGGMQWPALLVREAQAMVISRGAFGKSFTADTTPAIHSITLATLTGRPGYDVQVENGQHVWIDAATAITRRELEPVDAGLAALSVMPGGRVTRVDRLTGPDYYYYARPGREVHLPAYRVVFDDAQKSRVYLNTVTGEPVGFVDGDTRAWRWWRDAMHSLDFPALNAHRALWSAIVLALLLGGVVSSGTGVWLAGRRMMRMVRRGSRSDVD